MRSLPRLALIAAACSTAAAFAAPTDVHPIGQPNNSYAQGVSGDGSTVVGSDDSAGPDRAFSLFGGTYSQLPLALNGSYAGANAVSFDGSVIVGKVDIFGGDQCAAIWTNGVLTVLPLGSYAEMVATGVSADGLTVVGFGVDGVGRSDVFYRGPSNVVTSLASVFGTTHSRAAGVSGDGTLIVGTLSDDFYSFFGTRTGFIHQVGGSYTVIDPSATGPVAFAGRTMTHVTGISANGAVTVGYAYSSLININADALAFRRESNGTITSLGTLGGGWSQANAVNADGSVIVGQSRNSNSESEAFVYQNGTMTGLGLLTGGSSSSATGVSADGSVIVGFALTSFGDVHAITYANGTLLDATEWMRSLNGPGGLTAMANNLSSLPLEGAHHRPLMSYDGMGKQRQFWATGDFGASSRQTDRRSSFGEVGASQAYGDTLVGVAVGTALQTQDLLFGGDAKITGQTFMAEIDTRVADKESILSLLVLRGEWDAQTARGYVTGGGNDISRGQTDMDTTTVRVRYDGPTQKFTGNFTVAPYASFALTRVNTDGFAESGGSFPATFDAHTHTAKESRLGLLTKFVAGPATTIRVTAEWIHRFDDAGDVLSGVNQTTSGAFSVAGLAPTKDQARFGFDVDHKLSADTMLSLSIHAAGYGQAHDVAGSLSLRRGF
jgi:probable HAF family extracellular repeat protein